MNMYMNMELGEKVEACIRPEWRENSNKECRWMEDGVVSFLMCLGDKSKPGAEIKTNRT